MAGLAVVGRRGVGCQCAHGGGRARPAGAGRWQRAASGRGTAEIQSGRGHDAYPVPRRQRVDNGCHVRPDPCGVPGRAIGVGAGAGRQAARAGREHAPARGGAARRAHAG
ncbi:hypothetical protein G6F46_015159 [Rhizopus delemar]|nr:hypothetical protein G6F46_015159 [Rhizopus delemar]